MSTIKVDTLVAADGSSPVALTKQEAVKAHLGYNLNATTYLNIANNTINTESFNFSSVSDTGTGAPDCFFTSNMASNQYTFLSGCVGTNNVACIKIQSTTSALEMQYSDADSSTANDTVGYGAVLGDLA
jgi:hypothetical protein